MPGPPVTRRRGGTVGRSALTSTGPGGSWWRPAEIASRNADPGSRSFELRRWSYGLDRIYNQRPLALSPGDAYAVALRGLRIADRMSTIARGFVGGMAARSMRAARVIAVLLAVAGPAAGQEIRPTLDK